MRNCISPALAKKKGCIIHYNMKRKKINEYEYEVNKIYIFTALFKIK